MTSAPLCWHVVMVHSDGIAVVECQGWTCIGTETMSRSRLCAEMFSTFYNIATIKEYKFAFSNGANIKLSTELGPGLSLPGKQVKERSVP